MNKSLILAGAIALGLSGAAMAQNSPEQGVNVNSNANSEPMPGSTAGVVGQPQFQTDANAAATEPSLPNGGETPGARPNSDYGTLEPGSADTTRDSIPSTTRNADTTETRAPLAGANSFTQAEAERRIISQGYTQVSGLAKDDQSIWRGTAVKNGTPVDVAMDYRGNVTDQSK
jgi:hypothetical protein